jgi:hypothetical protein
MIGSMAFLRGRLVAFLVLLSEIHKRAARFSCGTAPTVTLNSFALEGFDLYQEGRKMLYHPIKPRVLRHEVFEVQCVETGRLTG